MRAMAHAEEPGIYSIGAVARMLDIPTSTLRAWEERYGLISPARSGGAQRLYSTGQVEQLRFLKAQIDAGASAADAHRLLARGMHGAHPAPPGSAPSSGRRPLVLIVERDAFAADLAEDYLTGHGFEVAIAGDAAQARRLFLERKPGAVVVDLLVGAGSGYRLVEEMAAAPVIAVSVIDSSADAIRSGAATFMHKPVDAAALEATIRNLLASPPARRNPEQAAVT